MDYHEEPPIDSGAVAASDAPTDRGLSPTPRGHPIIAWVVIILVVGFVTLSPFVIQEDKRSVISDTVEAVTDVAQARFIVGLHKLGSETPQQEAQFLGKFDSGTVDRRFRHIVLIGELRGPRQAAEALDKLHETLAANRVTLSQHQSRIDNILERLYRDYSRQRFNAPSLREDNRNYLREQMGWFGQLALAPSGGPNADEREKLLGASERSALIAILLVLFGLLAGLLGFAALVLFVVLAATGMVHSGLGPRSSFGGVYAEAFALWMAIYVGILLGISLVPFNTPFLRENRFFLEGLAMLSSLFVLAWPVIRGVPWRQVRADIGWTRGRRGLLEPFIGMISYPAIIGPLVVAVLAVFIITTLMTLGQPATDPRNDFSAEHLAAHPIVSIFKNATPWLLLQVLFIASVVAPIVEETMFRGFLYRHLRDASYMAATFGSSVASATISSFVFAIVHPQGIVAVPVLMVLAFMMCLLREWRGSLLPSMMLHAVNNGLVFTLCYIMMA
jgi:membrane protease YdiL (CAAX protease family)